MALIVRQLTKKSRIFNMWTPAKVLLPSCRAEKTPCTVALFLNTQNYAPVMKNKI